MSRRQPKLAPTLKVGYRIQDFFQFVEDEKDGKDIMEWWTGTAIEVSNGHNLKQGTRHYCKDRAVEVLWEDSNEEISAPVVEIKKSVFNSYVDHSWRMVFDVPWSNITLQSSCNAKEKRDVAKLTQDVEGW